jgi:hypothetical protein
MDEGIGHITLVFRQVIGRSSTMCARLTEDMQNPPTVIVQAVHTLEQLEQR